MQFFSNYTILPELNLIIEYWHGPVTLKTFIAHKKHLVEDENFRHNMKYLIDYRDASFIANIKEIEEYIDFAQKDERPSNLSAFLTITPNQVTVAEMFKRLKGDTLGKPSIFATFSAALKWLKIQENNFEFIQTILFKLKQKK